MSSDVILRNVEKRIKSLYDEYREQAKHVKNMNSAEKLINLEYIKVNNYIVAAIEEAKMNAVKEILNKIGSSESEKFAETDFIVSKLSKASLNEREMYVTNIKVKNIVDKDSNSRDNNLARNIIIAGGGTIIGAGIGGSISEKISGSILGAVLGCAFGLAAVAGINSMSSSNNDSVKEVRKEVKSFNNAKLISLLNEREKYSRDIICKSIMKIDNKFNEVCRGR